MKELSTELKRALNRTWEAIAYDILSAVADGGDPEKVSIKQAEVIEVVLDADHLEINGDGPAEEVKAFRALPYKEQIRLAKTVFTYTRYGI